MKCRYLCYTKTRTSFVYVLSLRPLIKQSNSYDIPGVAIQQVQPYFLWLVGSEIHRIVRSSGDYSIKRGYSFLARVTQTPAVILGPIQKIHITWCNDDQQYKLFNCHHGGRGGGIGRGGCRVILLKQELFYHAHKRDRYLFLVSGINMRLITQCKNFSAVRSLCRIWFWKITQPPEFERGSENSNSEFINSCYLK